MIAVPIHITGFFYPKIRSNIHYTGSLGAGFSLKEYVRTRVQKRNDKKIRIFFNGENVTSRAHTSLQAANEFFNAHGEEMGIDIFHQFDVPTSSGLATSGAGALGVVFALNEEFNTSFSDVKLATLAHIAEVKQKTGLGSVIAQYKGQFEIRMKAGAPNNGKVKRITRNVKCGILGFDHMETKNILKSTQQLQRIRKAFGRKHKKLANSFSIRKFTRFSQQFARESGLLTPFLQNLLGKARERGLHGSMLMLGDGVFLFGNNLEQKLERLKKMTNKVVQTAFVSQISNKGVIIGS